MRKIIIYGNVEWETTRCPLNTGFEHILRICFICINVKNKSATVYWPIGHLTFSKVGNSYWCNLWHVENSIMKNKLWVYLRNNTFKAKWPFKTSFTIIQIILKFELNYSCFAISLLDLIPKRLCDGKVHIIIFYLVERKTMFSFLTRSCKKRG